MTDYWRRCDMPVKHTDKERDSRPVTPDSFVPPRAPAVVRAVAILNELAEASSRQPLSLSDLAARVGVPKSSLLNICNALADGRLIRKVGSGYTLGNGIVELSSSYLGTIDEVHEFYTVCHELIPDFDETIHLGALNGQLEVVYLARLERRIMPILSPIGSVLPANCSATGKALLASVPQKELERRLDAAAELPALTDRSITSRAALEQELATVRERGYAIDDEETTKGVMCIAMAVPSKRAERWAVGVTLLRSVQDEDRLTAIRSDIDLVINEMSRRLGT